MDLAEALEIVCGTTGHDRYRQLCDPGDPAYDPAYIPLVLELAKHPGAPRPAQAPAAPTIPLAGDLVAAMTARIGADRLARWVAAKLGTDCGCAGRQEALNRLDARLRAYLARGGPGP